MASNHVAPKISAERWVYLKSLRVRPSLFWASATKGTYNVGRNKAKREKRASRSAAA